MSQFASSVDARVQASSVRWPDILPIALFVVLAFGTVRVLAQGLWQTDDHAFAPIILVMAIVMAIMIYRRGSSQQDVPLSAGLPVMIGATLLILLGYVVNNVFLRSSGLLGMSVGLVAFLYGLGTLRRYAYPFIASLFVLPLPGAIVTDITFPMKLAISSIATKTLFAFGFPVGSEGVVIDIGNYRLLVADACSGLQSMYSLIAVAVAYLFMMRIEEPRRAIALMLLSLPIVFILNVLRVIAVALLTYWFGNDVGEGFAHGVAGMIMFILAFFMLMGADKLLELLWKRKPE